MTKNVWKRVLSITLALALVLTSVSINWSDLLGLTSEVVSAEGIITVTDGQIISSNYEELAFTDAEKAILNNTDIRGEVHSLVAPDADDSLISVDSTAKEISAKDYTDAYNNVWTAVAAVVVYDGGKEAVSLTDGKGSFVYAGNDYSVEVTYEASVDVENQNIIANIPAYLAQGVYNMDTLADTGSTYLMLMETIVPNMLPLVDGSLGYTLEDGAAKTAINALNAQLEENGSLKLMAYADGYAAAASKVQYLMEYGAAAKACLIETYDYVKAIAEDESIADLIEKVSATGLHTATVNKVNRAMTQFKLFVAEMADVYADDWKALDAAPVKTGADYAALDTLVAAAANSTERSFEAKNPLVAATTVITANVNRYNVTIKLNASVVPANQNDSAALGALDEYVEVVTLPSEATKADIVAAVEASLAETEAIAAWNYGISEDYYTRTVSELPETLTEDIVYTITYAPKTYKLTFTYDESLNKEVPYGYNHTFEVCADLDKSYDYQVAGKTYMQGAVYPVTGNTEISRTEGKAREAYRLSDIVASDYADVLTEKEIAILNSAALISDTIGIRVVDNTATDQIVISGQTVTANSYDAGADGLVWQPVTAKLVNDDAVIETVSFNGNAATFDSTDYELIRVEYVLAIKNGNDATVLELLNIANELVTEADTQKADVEQLLVADVYDNLGEINKTMLNAMAGNLGDESKAAIEVIKSTAFNDATGKFYLYEYLTAYKANGLTYYYQDGNSQKIKDQVMALSEQLEIVAADPLLPSLLEDLGYGDYKDKIDKVVEKLNSMKDSFAAPNAAIDTDSEELAALVEAIEMDGSVNTYEAADGLKLTVELDEVADNRLPLTITINVLKGNGQVAGTKTVSFTYVKGSLIEDDSKILSAIAAAEAELKLDKDNYTCEQVGTLPQVGSSFDAATTVVYTWKPDAYTLSIDGTEEVINFTYDNKKVVLPVCDEAGYVYVYTINGSELEVNVNNNTYTFTDEELATLFTDGNLVIAREKIDVNRRNILSLVAELNAAIEKGGVVDGNGNLGMAFIPVDNNGQLEIVLRVVANSSLESAPSAVTALAETLVTSKYAYIGMDGDPFLNEGIVSVQTVINMVLGNEGFGTQTVLDLIDENGNINELKLDNATVIGATDNSITVGSGKIAQVDVLGGKVLETNLELAVTANATAYDVPLYITVEDFDAQSDNLLKVRKGVEKLVNYVEVECVDDRLNVNITAPDKAYAAVLAEMLITGNVELDAVEDINLEDFINYNYDVVEPVLTNTELDTDTIVNTLAKVGYDVDLDTYDKYIVYALRGIRHLINNVDVETVVSEGGQFGFDASYPIGLALDKVNVDDLYKNMIAEKDTEVTLPAQINFINMDKAYQALVLDNTKAGLEKLTLTADAQSAVTNAGDSAIVILLGDVEGDLHFTNQAILNLNGKKINGNLTSDAAVIVVDSTLGNTAEVTGTVSGTFLITAGKYAADVSSMLATGYAQVDGAVVNPYYTITKDEAGNLTVLVDAGFMKLDQDVAYKYLALEMAVDVILNAYCAGGLTIDGNEIYSVEFFNLLENYYGKGLSNIAESAVETINCEGVEAFANAILADFTAFDEMAIEIAGDKAIASYEIVTAPWDIELTLEGEGDNNYIDASIVNGDNTKTRTVKFVVAGSDEEKAELVALCEHLAEVVVINDLSVDVNDLTYADRNIAVDAFANVDVTFDLSVDNNYAVAIGVILANNAEDSSEMVAAINEALADPASMDALVAAIEQYTLADVIAAMKAARGVEFDTMLANLGISADAAKEIEAVYHDLLNVIYAALIKLDITGNSVTLADCKVDGSYATYVASKENWHKTDIKVTLILAEEIEEVEPTPTPTATPATETPTPTPVTETPTPTPATETPTPTPATETPTPTPVTETPTPTPVTETPTPTPVTETPTPTPVTETPTPTPVTETPTPTPVTETPTPTPVTETPTPTPVTETPTPTPITETPTPTPVTETPTPTPSETETLTPTPSETVTPTPTDDPWIWGDIDHNGIVDARDALLALQHAAKLTKLEGNAFKYGDVNQDGVVDAKDANAILHYAAKFIDMLPVLKPTLGDVDRDGDIDPVDALLVLKYAAKLINKFDEDVDLNNISKVAAEVTFDGAISAPDALEILKYAAKVIDKFEKTID